MTDGMVNLELKTPGELLDEIVLLRVALAPFAADKLPSARRTEIAYDRHGLRRCISPLELARDAAHRALSNGSQGGDNG